MHSNASMQSQIQGSVIIKTLDAIVFWNRAKWISAQVIIWKQQL